MLALAEARVRVATRLVMRLQVTGDWVVGPVRLERLALQRQGRVASSEARAELFLTMRPYPAQVDLALDPAALSGRPPFPAKAAAVMLKSNGWSN